MNDISIGAVGAALIAGLISLVGLIIGKEQKTSEFRQAWIDELRKCLISYLSNINAICDIARLRNASQPYSADAFQSTYKQLNEASHGIELRVNASERQSRSILSAMREFEKLAQRTDTLTPEAIKLVEKRYLKAARKLLKFEWKRVKRGEGTFRVMKWLMVALIVISAAVLTYKLVLQFYTPAQLMGSHVEQKKQIRRR